MSTRRPQIPVMLQLGIGLAVLTAIGFWVVGYTRQGEAPPSSSGNFVDQLRDVAQDATTDPKKTRDEELAYQAKAAIAVVENEKTLALADETLHTLDQAERETKTWAEEVEPLLTSEVGKRLAADATRVRAFRRAYRAERPAPTVLVPTRRGAEVLKGQVEAVLKHRDTAYTATEERAKLTEALKVAQGFVDAYRAPREEIESLVRQGNLGGQTSAVTLEAALQAEADSETAAAAQAEARREQEATAEAERKKDELAAAARQAEDARLAGAAAASELHRQAEDAAVQAQFQPFLAKGRYCGGPINNPYFLREDGLLFDYPRPMSYGCLARNDHVLQDYGAFMNLAQGRGNDRVNDRPRWPIARDDAENREYYRRFQLFQQLAQIWKDMGVLSP